MLGKSLESTSAAERPHYTLLATVAGTPQPHQWKFILKSAGRHKLSAADNEPEMRQERLELLAIVRGLEALEQPSRVTVVTPSQYVRRGVAYGLEEWRANGWTWEHFGQMVLVKNHDLWQRLDHALTIHQVEWKSWRVDPPHDAKRMVRPAAKESSGWDSLSGLAGGVMRWMGNLQEAARAGAKAWQGNDAQDS